MGMAPTGAAEAISVVDASKAIGVGAGVGLAAAAGDTTAIALDEGGVVRDVVVVVPAAPHAPIATMDATNRNVFRRFNIEPHFCRRIMA